MFKNTTGQKIAVFAFDGTTGAGKTGDASNITVYVNKDWAGANALGDTSATEIDATKAPGCYLFDLTQAETNGDALHFTGKSTTSNINVVQNLIFTTPPNFSTLSVDSSGFCTLATAQRPGVRKNTALSNFAVFMTDSTNHSPATSKTVAVTRSIDHAAFGTGTIGTVTELANGWYYFDLGAGDLNGDIILIRATATGCDDVNLLIRTSP